MNLLHKNRALCIIQNSTIHYIHTETLINMSQNILFFFTLLLMKAVMMFFRRQIVHVSVFNSPATDVATFRLQGLTWYVLYFFHVQAMVRLRTFGIFNMWQMLMQVMAHGGAVQIAKSLHWKGILGTNSYSTRELNLHQQYARLIFNQLSYLPTTGNWTCISRMPAQCSPSWPTSPPQTILRTVSTVLVDLLIHRVCEELRWIFKNML